MPIKSYLAHPHKGRKEELIKVLLSIDACEILPAQNEDVIALVTETNSKKEEEELETMLESIDSLKLLAMVAGFSTP